MIDFKNFKIKRGPSKDLHDPRLIVEEGYWYLSTDKAELFIGIVENGTPVLKPINGELIPEVNLEGYATEDFVREAIKNIDIPEVELYDDTELRNLINSKADSVHSHEEYALAEHTHDEYLTEHQSLVDYAKKADLFSKDYNDLTNKPEIPSIEGLASETYVQTEIGKINLPETDLSNYYTKEEVDALLPVEEIEEVKTKVETVLLPKVEEEIEPTVGELKTWVENKEYLQDIDLDGYATEEYVDNAIANIEHPANPTKVSELENDANYTNETKVLELIENNASSKIGIDFVTDITVGHLVAGTEISKDMTIGQLLYKMLFVGTQPDEPEVPEGVIGEIIAKELPMYSIDYDGNVTAKEFEVVTFNGREEANQAPVESCFYQVKDETGEIIESGYQDMQIVNDEMYYIIALPKIVDYNSNMVKMQAYDDEEQLWVDYTKLPLISDPEIVASCCDEVGVDISHINQDLYTVWVNEDTCTGSRLRYIIEE